MTTTSSNLWQTILKDCSTGKVEEKKRNIIVLGNEKDGKAQIVRYLQGESIIREIDEIRGTGTFSFGLNYNYIKHNDETINVYEIEDPSFADFLDLVIKNPEELENTMAIITLDVTKIGSIIEVLTMWLKRLENELERVLSKFEPAKVAEMKKKFKAKYESKTKKNHVLITKNLGLPLLVVVTKSDMVWKVADENHVNKYDYLINRGEGSKYFLNFMQYCIRRKIVDYGASLIYCSTKEGFNNCKLLQNVIVDVFFGLSKKKEVVSASPKKSGAEEKRKKVKTKLNTPVTQRHDSIYIPFRYDTKLSIADLPVEQLVKEPEKTTLKEMVKKKEADKKKEKNMKIPSFQKFLRMQRELRKFNSKTGPQRGGGGLFSGVSVRKKKKPKKDSEPKKKKRVSLINKKKKKKLIGSKEEKKASPRKARNKISDIPKRNFGKSRTKFEIPKRKFGKDDKKGKKKIGKGKGKGKGEDRDEIEDFFTSMLKKLKK